MKILVTGGLGFIGSHLVDQLVEMGYNVHVLDGLQTGSNIANANALATYHVCNLANADQVDRIFQSHNFNQVYHLAAESHVDRAIANAQPFIDSNITGTYNLFKSIAEYRPATRVLLFSTDEVMGELHMGSFREGDITLPKNMYSMTKQAQEAIARSYYYSDNINVVTSRCSNIYGPRQAQEKFLPVIISSVLRGKQIPIYGDGKQIREWTHVKDASSGAIFVMENGLANEVYHIGSAIEKENIDVVKFVLSKMGQSEDLMSYVQDRKGHDKRYSLCVDKINQMGWKSKIQFEEGIEETIEWYKQFPL